MADSWAPTPILVGRGWEGGDRGAPASHTGGLAIFPESQAGAQDAHGLRSGRGSRPLFPDLATEKVGPASRGPSELGARPAGPRTPAIPGGGCHGVMLTYPSRQGD